VARANVAACKAELDAASLEDLPRLIRRYSKDDREGVRTAVAQARRRLKAERAEAERLLSLAELEASLHAQGFALVAGLDEVGRGALAGPVTAAAVILPDDTVIPGLDDSKRLGPEKRDELAVVIQEVAVAWRIAHVSPEEIDALGIAGATRRAMSIAFEALDPRPDHIVVDGRGIGLGVPETPVVGGDGKVAAIAAASIIAKVARDGLMRSLACDHPHYGFDVNKGYGTSDHMEALATHGLCPLHRRSFTPCESTSRLF